MRVWEDYFNKYCFRDLGYDCNIYIVPAIKKLTLTNIGNFEHAEFNFSSGMNFIIGMGATGKTTVINSILAGLSGCMPEFLKRCIPDEGQVKSKISIELQNKELKIDSRIIEKINNLIFRDNKERLSAGEIEVKRIIDVLDILNGTQGYCCLMDNFLSVPDYMNRLRAARRIIRINSQVIAGINQSIIEKMGPLKSSFEKKFQLSFGNGCLFRFSFLLLFGFLFAPIFNLFSFRFSRFSGLSC